MNHNINSLIELRDKYIKALELKNRDYCIINNLQFGLCKCINHLPISAGLMDDVQYLLYNWATDTGLKKYNTAYFWPTPWECDFEDIISDAITPRINCLKELIKIVSDGTE